MQQFLTSEQRERDHERVRRETAVAERGKGDGVGGARGRVGDGGGHNTVRTPVAGTQLGKMAAAGRKVAREGSWAGLAPWTPAGGSLSP